MRCSLYKICVVLGTQQLPPNWSASSFITTYPHLRTHSACEQCHHRRSIHVHPVHHTTFAMLGTQQLRTARYIVGCISCSCCDGSAHWPHLARGRSRVRVWNNTGQFHVVLGAKQVWTTCQRQLHSQSNTAKSCSFIPSWTITTVSCW